jgi:hypothetical protein
MFSPWLECSPAPADRLRPERFEAADAAAGSIIEAGFDNVTVTRQ